MAEDFRGFAEDIANMYRDRRAFISQLKAELPELLTRFKSERTAEFAKLVRGLKSEDKARTAEFAKLVTDIKSEGRARAAEVAELMAGLKSEDRARAAEVAEFMAGFKSERTTESAHLMANLKSINAGRKAGWREAMDIVAAGKGRVGVAVKPERRIAKPPEVEKEVVEEEAALEETSLEEEVLSLIHAHPEGMRLVDIEAALGIARIRVATIAKRLIEEGKVRKEDLLYFPVW